MSDLTVITWNLEWARANSSRGLEIREIIESHEPEVVCLTEAFADFFPNGHVVSAEADYGYGTHPTKRKVVLWSRRPWRDVDLIGDPRLPSGRFCRATTDTQLGPVEFVGVCIPWKDAHVMSGLRNRRRWEDHETYLRTLPAVLRQTDPSRRVLLGDFNETIPRTRAPQSCFALLMDAIRELKCITRGDSLELGLAVIDHICVSASLSCRSVSVLEPVTAAGKRLSDHSGLAVHLGLAD
jgi:endonuclease/exonuclease/phosphatase family metal-dependent hydrolase